MKRTIRILLLAMGLLAGATGAQAQLHDAFDRASIIIAASGCGTDSNVSATKEPGERAHAGDPGGHSLWYRWTPSVSGPVVFRTHGSSFDTLLAVYTGASVTALTLVDENDDELTPDRGSRVTFNAVAGVRYSIAVDGFGGQTGQFVLTWSPAVNDHFAGATALVGDSGSVDSSNVGCSREIDEPHIFSNGGGHSVWFRWIPRVSGPISFHTTGSDFDTLLGAYTGTCPASLSLLDDDDDSVPPRQSRITFNAIAGTVYYIIVDGWNGATGNIKLAWGPPSSPPRLTVGNVEVTQGIQTAGNSIPLLARRSTVVRATLNYAAGSSIISGISGRLHVFVNGVRLTPLAGVPAINQPFTAPMSPLRGVQNDTLNFRLGAPTAILASSDVDFQVEVFVPGQPGSISGFANNLICVDRTPPNVLFTRINLLTPSRPSGLPDPALIVPGRGDAFVRGAFPVDDSNPTVYRQGLFPPILVIDVNQNGMLDVGVEQNSALAGVTAARLSLVANGQGATRNTLVHAWVSGAMEANGVASPGALVSIGNTEPFRYQRTLAHELGHIFGSGHNNRVLAPDVGWDVTGLLSGNPSGNLVPGLVKPGSLSDVMVPALGTSEAWVNPDTYLAVMNNSITGPGSPPDSPLAPNSPQADAPAQPAVVIRGEFDPSGSRLLKLYPAWTLPWPVEVPPASDLGQYVAEVVDAEGHTTVTRFDALRETDAEGEGTASGFFQVSVPLSSAQSPLRVRISDARTGEVYGGFDRSLPPTLQLLKPDNGSALGETTGLAWRVTDPDTPDTNLVFQVAYSHDGGTNWVPLAVEVTTNRVVVNTKEILHSAGRGVIRVFVSDGLNTVFADATGLRTDAAIYGLEEGRLRIAHESDQVAVSWTGSAWHLQSAPAITGPWENVTTEPEVNGDRLIMREIPEGRARFYRLFRP